GGTDLKDGMRAMATDPNPDDLVNALGRGDAEAIVHLERWCREPIARLIDRILVRRRLGHDGGDLVDRTLRWVRMYLRSRDPSEFEGMGRDAFLAQICAAAFRMLTPPNPAPWSTRMRLPTFIRGIWGGLRSSRSLRAIGPSHAGETASKHPLHCRPY